MAKIKTSKMMVPVMKDEYTDKMSLNPYDQLFIKRMFDREDEYIAEIISEFTVKVGLVIEEKLQPVMDKLDEITKRLDNHEKRLQVIEGRLGIAS